MVPILEIKIHNILIMKTFYCVILFLVVEFLWIWYEIYRAPMMDDDGNIIKPSKKLKDLFKNKK